MQQDRIDRTLIGNEAPSNKDTEELSPVEQQVVKERVFNMLPISIQTGKLALWYGISQIGESIANGSEKLLQLGGHGLKIIAILAMVKKITGELSPSISTNNVISVRKTKLFKPNGEVLSDGEIINAGERIGDISIAGKLPQIKKYGIKYAGDSEARTLYYTKNILLPMVENDLIELANLCANNDPKVNGLVAFRGESHLAGSLAKRLGFDVHKIQNPLHRINLTIISWLIKERNMLYLPISERRQWRRSHSQRNYKQAQEAIISRKKLIELYAGKTPNFIPTE